MYNVTPDSGLAPESDVIWLAVVCVCMCVCDVDCICWCTVHGLACDCHCCLVFYFLFLLVLCKPKVYFFIFLYNALSSGIYTRDSCLVSISLLLVLFVKQVWGPLHTFHMPCNNSNVARFCGIAPCVSAKPHHTTLLGCFKAISNACGRIGMYRPISCCVWCCCRESQCKFLKKQQIMQSSLIQN